MQKNIIIKKDQLKSVISEIGETLTSDSVRGYAFDWDDNKSMLANNTSCFNYRTTQSGKMSEHAKGLAIDINPFNNPYISRSKKIYPSGAFYDYDSVGTINSNSNVIKYFKEIGWKWGGDWIYSKDYQHFSLSGR